MDGRHRKASTRPGKHTKSELERSTIFSWENEHYISTGPWLQVRKLLYSLPEGNPGNPLGAEF